MSTDTSARRTASIAELTGAEAAALPPAPDPQASPQLDTLARDLGVLTTQNRQLIKSVTGLLDLYETERAQRQALQSGLDRILEEVTSEPAAIKAETLATEVRQAVSDDLKPLLHAILDLLEITMRRTPFDIAASAEPSPPAPEADSQLDEPGEPGEPDKPGEADGPAPIEPSDDLPRDLPEILTKSVEELMGRARRTPSDEAREAQPAPGDAGPKTSPSRRRRSVLNQEERSHAWIPVTSDTA